MGAIGELLVAKNALPVLVSRVRGSDSQAGKEIKATVDRIAHIADANLHMIAEEIPCLAPASRQDAHALSTRHKVTGQLPPDKSRGAGNEDLRGHGNAAQ